MNKKLLLFLYLLPILPLSLYAMQESISASQDTLIERASIAYKGICKNFSLTTEDTKLIAEYQEIQSHSNISSDCTPDNIAYLVTARLLKQTEKNDNFIAQLLKNQEDSKIVKDYLTNIADYAAQKKNKEISETFAETSRSYQSKISSSSRNKWLYWITGGALAGGACYWAYIHGKDAQLPTPFSFSTISNAVSSLLNKATTTQHIIAGSSIGTALLCGILGIRECTKQTTLTKKLSEPLSLIPLLQTNKTITYITDEDAIGKIIASTNIQALFGQPLTKEKKSDSEEEEDDDDDDVKEIKKIADDTSKEDQQPIDPNLTEGLEQYLKEKPISQSTTETDIRQYVEEPEEYPSRVTIHTNLIHELEKPDIWQKECRNLIAQKKHEFILNLMLNTNPENPYLTFKIIKQKDSITLEITTDDEQKRSNFTHEQVEDLIKDIEKKQRTILEQFNLTKSKKSNKDIQKQLSDEDTEIYRDDSDSSEQGSSEENSGEEQEKTGVDLLGEILELTEGEQTTLYSPGKNTEQEELTTDEKIEKINNELKELIKGLIRDNIPLWPLTKRQEFTLEISGNTASENKFAIVLIPPIGNNRECGIKITHDNNTTNYFASTQELCIDKICSYIEKIENQRLADESLKELADELLTTEFSSNDQLPELIQQFCQGQDNKVVYDVRNHDNEQGILILEKAQDNLLKRTWIINNQTETVSYKSKKELLANSKSTLNPTFIGHSYLNLNELFKTTLMQLVDDFIKNNKPHETYTWVDETGKQAILTLNKSPNEIQRIWKIGDDENSSIIMSSDDQGILPTQNFVGIRKL